MNFFEWNACPPELVCLIFSYLDAKTLVQCLSVSRQWKDVAEHTIERYKLWPEIINNEMINNAKTFIQKSTLPLQNIFRNYVLWRHINISHITNVKTYEMQVVRKINVYKDKLTVIADSCIMFYDIHTFTLKKTIDYNINCVNYEENDYLVVMVDEDDEKHLKLRYYVKCPADDDDNPRNWYTFDGNVQLYRLDRSFCYIYADNKLWMLTDTIMYTRFVARHYGSDYDPVTAIHVHNDSVYLVTRWGTVWCADFNAVKFDKVCSLWVPHNMKHHSWVMFDSLSCVVSVQSTSPELVNVIYDPASDALRLECPALTCALQHGDVLLLGYVDGTVEIRIPEKKVDSPAHPNRRFNIKKFAGALEDPAIVDINVGETENRHVLLVGTKTRVFCMVISYPEYLL